MIGNILGGAMGKLAPATDFESISTTTVGAGGTSTITFSSIPSTYQHLQIRMMAITSTGASITVRFNSDSGSNYSQHQIFGDGGSAGSGGGVSQTSVFASLMGGSSTAPGGSIIEVLDYNNSNKNSTVRSLGGYDANGSGYIMLRSGVWMNTAAVTTIQLGLSTGTFSQYTHAALYGIKG